MLQKIDNGSDGNCMYYAYAISLMYYLRARNDDVVTAQIFDRLKLHDDEKLHLNAILALNPKGRIAQVDQDALELIVGNAARALGKERTLQEYQTNYRDTGFFISAQYGIEYYFKQELEQIVPEKTQQIENNFDNPALTDADIYRVQGIGEAMRAFAAEHWSLVAVQLLSQPWDEVMEQWTKKFFDDNNAQYLNAYINRLGTNAVWGTEETLYLIHEGIQGKRQEQIEPDFWIISYDTPIALHTYVNGQNPYVPKDQPDMILDNLNQGHWVSQIPENIFNGQSLQMSSASSPQKQKCMSPKDSQILYLEKEQAVHQLQINGLSIKLEQLAQERAEREEQCRKDEQLARELQIQVNTGFEQLEEQKSANIEADEQLARELHAQEQAEVAVQQQIALAEKARQEADAQARAEEQARIMQESIEAHEELERIKQQVQKDLEFALQLQSDEGSSVTLPQQQPALTVQEESRVEAADLAMAEALSKASAEFEARARTEADAQAKAEQLARERAQATAQALAAAEARAQALAAEQAKVAAQIAADHQLAQELHVQEEEQRKKLDLEVERRKKADAYLQQIKKAIVPSASLTKPASSITRKEIEEQIKKDQALARKLQQRILAKRNNRRLPVDDSQQQNTQSTGFSTGSKGIPDASVGTKTSRVPAQLTKREALAPAQASDNAPKIKAVVQPQTEVVAVVTQSPAEMTRTLVAQDTAGSKEMPDASVGTKAAGAPAQLTKRETLDPVQAPDHAPKIKAVVQPQTEAVVTQAPALVAQNTVAVPTQVNAKDKNSAEALSKNHQVTKDAQASVLNQDPENDMERQAQQDRVSLPKSVIQPSQEMVEHFNTQLKLLLDKNLKFYKRALSNDKDTQKFWDAYLASYKLYDKLKTTSSAYFKSPSKDGFIEFKKNCDQAIKNSRGILEQHRGFKQLLGNLALAIIGLGVFYGIAVGINYVNNKSLFFKFKTDSEKVVIGLEQSIDKLKPKA